MQPEPPDFSSLIRRRMLSTLFSLLAVLAWPKYGIAQTVRVDATPGHEVNTFSPLSALGSTVDRVPSNAT
ncbi:MAG: hypothetical protein WBQ08_02505, partial [Candidatus Sulfotelmatobacter sp.]